ncbi:retropepsin-like aspartic protease [Yeosuana sp. MJ-SS3]|uniref:Retropepsin-like aspartic protease n=1 Tax=Gilvirhabdus luticola TaxID=3079858 RepID=A0ABU3U9Q9_9FLAO|nr:retropepsin-like aspartic protease [Yeosuana sp. MJ-SS3]MDU8887135.1 retropepsin-like aspartic protease [Yeosuana sp. MJ-SS3]
MKVINFLFIVFAIQFNFSQNINFSKGKAAKNKYYSEISFEFVKGKIIIPVTIEGKTYRFLLDTGAPNLITANLKNVIQHKEGANMTIKDANSNKSSMEVINIPSLTLGNIQFNNQTALVYPSDNNLIFDCFQVDGFIGSNLLRNSIIKFQLKEKKVIITNDIKKVNPNKNYKSELIIVGAQSSPYIHIKIKGEKNARESLLFDTGMDGFYDLSLNHYNLFSEQNVLTTHSQGSGSIGMSLFGNAKANNQYRLKIPEIHFKNVIFKNVITETSDDNNSKIGVKLLEYGNIIIDFKHKDFYFEPFEQEVDLDEKLLGFSPTIIDNKVVVGIVWDETLEDKLAFGDEIISVNGLDFTQMEICNLLTNKSPFEDEDNFTVQIKNSEGELKTLNINKQ